MKWVKRFGSVLKGCNRYAGDVLPDTLVVDETELQIGHRTHYLWDVLDNRTMFLKRVMEALS